MRSIRITGMTPPNTNHAAILGRTVLVLALAAWTFSLLRTPLPELGNSFMHLINLPFHEAGHIVFMPFGAFMMSLGGSLLQLLVPLICAWAFLFQQDDPFGASVCLWWTGESLLDPKVTARAQSPFTDRVTFVSADGVETLPLLAKTEVARRLVAKLAERLGEPNAPPRR